MKSFPGTVGVSEVRDQREVVEPLFRVLGAARNGRPGTSGAIMVVAAILLDPTSIRLSAMSREQETQIMRYVGAFEPVHTLHDRGCAGRTGGQPSQRHPVRGCALRRPGVDGLLPSSGRTYCMGEVAIMTLILVLAAVAL